MTLKAGHTAGPRIEQAINAEAAKWAEFFGVTDAKEIEGRKQVMRANVAVGFLDPLLPFITDDETGLTPRQLAEQRDELLAALCELRPALLANHGCKGGLSETTRKRAYAIVSAAIAKATAGGAL